MSSSSFFKFIYLPNLSFFRTDYLFLEVTKGPAAVEPPFCLTPKKAERVREWSEQT